MGCLARAGPVLQLESFFHAVHALRQSIDGSLLAIHIFLRAQMIAAQRCNGGFETGQTPFHLTHVVLDRRDVRTHGAQMFKDQVFRIRGHVCSVSAGQTGSRATAPVIPAQSLPPQRRWRGSSLGPSVPWRTQAVIPAQAGIQ